MFRAGRLFFCRLRTPRAFTSARAPVSLAEAIEGPSNVRVLKHLGGNLGSVLYSTDGLHPSSLGSSTFRTSGMATEKQNNLPPSKVQVQ